MLQSIHDKLTGIFAIILLGAIAVVFVFWGVDASVGTFSKARGIEVNGIELDAEQVRRGFQEELVRYQTALGTADVPAQMREQLQQAVVEQAVQTELIRQRTLEERYAASDAQVLEAVQQIPAFHVDGRFSRDAYYAALRAVGVEPSAFEAEQRTIIATRQLDRGLTSSAFVLPGELERRVALLNETRELAWLRVPAERFLAGITLEDEAVRRYYEDHSERWMTQEQATVEYLLLDIDALAEDVETSEEALQRFYEENESRFVVEDRRRARHILIEAGDDAAAAKARAGELARRAQAGEDFAALAEEHSADVASAGEGGDLGWAERSFFDPAFADAVWAMQPGEVRGPVESSFGFHVIRLDEIQPGSRRSLEEVRAEIEPEVRRAEVEQLFGDLQDELDTAAFEAAGNLQAVAERLKLPVQSATPFTRSGHPALGSAPELISAVFAPDTVAGRELRTVEIEPGRVVALRVAAHAPPAVRPFEEVRADVLAAARAERAEALAAEQAAALAGALKEGGDWAALSRRPGLDAGSATPQNLGRDAPGLPAEIAGPAFQAPAPAGQPRYGTARLASGDAAVWRLSAVRPGSLEALPVPDRQAEARTARQRAAQGDVAAYLASMRADADVDVNPQIFE